MITRKLGKLFRGEATPFQLMLACILGAVIGFLPGFSAAPGLFAFFVLLLVVLNANLFLAGVVMLGAKLLSYALLPVSFAVGQFCIDGPLEGLLTWAINAPVLAWFGFETYVATGGLVIGLVVGLIAGSIVVRMVQGFRKKIGELREGSEAYNKWVSNPLIKVAVWLFFGGGSKKDPEALRAKTIGNPIRPLGLVLVVLVVICLTIASLFLQDMILTTAARSGLERVNGASVDLDRVNLDLANSKLTVEGLALTDPQDLMRNSFSASRITADLSGLSLLRKKVVIDRIEISDGQVGSQRNYPGTLVGPRPRPPEPAAEDTAGRTLDDYLATAQVWRDRLAQVRRWMDRFANSSGDDAATPEAPAAQEISLRERLRQQAEALGYAAVRADHRITKEPTLTIRELSADGVRVDALPDERLRVSGRNLSTQPWLLAEGPSIDIAADSGKMRFSFDAGAMGSGNGDNRITAVFNGYPVDSLRAALRDPAVFPLHGGVLDVAVNGSLNTANLHLPIEVTVRDTEISIAGSGSSKVSNIIIPVALRGPLDNPRIVISSDALKDALVAAGREELGRQVSGQIDRAIGDKIPAGILPGSGSPKNSDDKSDGEDKPSAGDAIRGLFR